MANMKVFKIKGIFKTRGRKQNFEKEIASESKKMALEKILSDIGSRHRVKRRDIKIDSVEKVKIDEVENPIVKQMVKGE